MASVEAEVASPLARNKRIIHLSSRLAEAHGYYFSGISGGALYAIEADGLVPMGIVFEGHPSSKKKTGEPESSTFLDEYDIFVRGSTLTPEIFGEWLDRAKLIR